MQPIVIQINGDFWDSFIFKGKLYLWSYSEELVIYEWDLIIDFLSSKYILGDYALALQFAFKHVEGIYEINDNERPKLKDQLQYLSSLNFELSENEIKRFVSLSLENPFPELPTDIEIYNDVVYAGTDLGLFKATIINDNEKIKIIKHSDKIWGETEVVRLKASQGGRLALSTGPDGLFEFRVGRYFTDDKDWFQVSNKHSSFADWNYSSLYNSSDEGDSFLETFEKIDNIEKAIANNWTEKDYNQVVAKREVIIKQVKTFTQKELFHVNGNTMSWGNGNKIYLWDRDKVIKADFSQFKVNTNAKADEIVNKINQIRLPKSYEKDIISAGVTYFGIIVELENSVIVIYEDAKEVIVYDLNTQIVKWRAFPRSVRYENHVHVITEDSLKILSFNNDSFNEQNKKKFGMKHSPKSNIKT